MVQTAARQLITDIFWGLDHAVRSWGGWGVVAMVIAALLGGGIMFVAMCAYIYRYRARWATPAVRAENAELREQHKADAAEITRHKAREAVMFSRPIVRAGEAVKKAIEEAGREL